MDYLLVHVDKPCHNIHISNAIIRAHLSTRILVGRFWDSATLTNSMDCTQCSGIFDKREHIGDRAEHGESRRELEKDRRD